MTLECLYDYDKPTPGFQHLSVENSGLFLCGRVSTLHILWNIQSDPKTSIQNLGFEFLNNLNQTL